MAAIHPDEDPMGVAGVVLPDVPVVGRSCICMADVHSPETCNPDCGCPQCWDTWADDNADPE
jgi:hypothetical protein